MPQLRILTPQTTDGKNLAYDEDNKVIYKESFVEAAAKRNFEALNAQLPKHLQHKIEVVNEEKETKKDGGKK